MKIRPVLFIKVKKLNLFFLFIISLFFNCSENEFASQNLSESVETDSIVNWIAESNNAELTEDQRLDILSKAYIKGTSVENDSLKAKYYSLLSTIYSSSKDSSRFREINKQSMAFNKIRNDTSSIAQNFSDLGFFFKTYSVKDSAYYAYSEAQKLFESIGEKQLSGKMFFQMAVNQMGVKDYVGSETSITRAIERFKPLNDNLNLFKSYNVLGIALGALGETEKSLAYYNEALYYLKQEPYDVFLEARIINNIGVVHRNNKQYEKAIINFKKVLDFEDFELNKPDLFAIAISNLASSRLYNKDTIGINKLFSKAIEMKSKNNQMVSLASTYFHFSKYKAYAKDTAAALIVANKAEEISLNNENNEGLLETWAFLAKLEKEKASQYFDQYIKLDDSLQVEERKQQNKFARIRFETDEFIAENVALESQKDMLSKQKQMWIGVAAAFFLLGLSIYIIINQRAKNQKLLFDQQQQANNQEIFNLMLMQKQKVDEVKRMEQKRISEELHDGILGKMLGARMVLTGLNKRSSDEAIQEKSKAISSLQEIENEIRSISHELSHTAYQKINNFTDSIESLLSSINKNVDIQTMFDYNEDEDWDSLAGDIKINVYRIIQETFQNAIKHSKCSTFIVAFDRTDTHFNVIMKDNGIGFNFDKGRNGIGIRNISSRIKKLSGKWHLDSKVGQGTTTSLKIPLYKNPTNSAHTKQLLENV